MGQVCSAAHAFASLKVDDLDCNNDFVPSSSKALDPTTAIEVENILYPAHNDDDVAKYEQAQVRSIEAAGDETHNACEFPADSSPEENSYVFLRCYCLC